MPGQAIARALAWEGRQCCQWVALGRWDPSVPVKNAPAQPQWAADRMDRHGWGRARAPRPPPLQSWPLGKRTQAPATTTWGGGGREPVGQVAGADPPPTQHWSHWGPGGAGPAFPPTSSPSWGWTGGCGLRHFRVPRSLDASQGRVGVGDSRDKNLLHVANDLLAHRDDQELLCQLTEAASGRTLQHQGSRLACGRDQPHGCLSFSMPRRWPLPCPHLPFRHARGTLRTAETLLPSLPLPDLIQAPTVFPRSHGRTVTGTREARPYSNPGLFWEPTWG